MKEKELREAAKCAVCSQPFGKSGLPLFYRVTVERYGLNANAVRRQAGLEMMIGNTAIAQAMGTDEDMATLMGEPSKFTLCEGCAYDEHSVPALAEAASEKEEKP